VLLQAARDIVIEQNQHGLDVARIEAVSGEVEDRFDSLDH
jgi:hypothetical protein